MKKVKGILNKLMLEKFDLLKGQLLDTRITSADILKDIMSLFFEKAVFEPTFCPMYAQLCYEVCYDLPSFPAAQPGGREITFRRLLLNNCQEVFEGANSLRVEIARLTGPDQVMVRRDKERIFKLRALGNIRLLAELMKIQMIPVRLGQEIVKKLLVADKMACPDEEHVEAICQFFNTVGKHLDEDPRSCQVNDTYFIKIKELVANPQLTPRSKCMLLDLIALRSNNWAPRHGEVGDDPGDSWHSEAACKDCLSNFGYLRAEMEKLKSEMEKLESENEKLRLEMEKIALEAEQEQTLKTSAADMSITWMMLLSPLLQDSKDSKNALKLAVAILFAILFVCVVGVMKM